MTKSSNALLGGEQVWVRSKGKKRLEEATRSCSLILAGGRPKSRDTCCRIGAAVILYHDQYYCHNTVP